MTELSQSRMAALSELYDDTKEHPDPEIELPLYSQLRGMEAHYGEPELLAVGGMKRILKVLDKRSNRYVAMAKLHEDASELLYEPFIREARLTAHLEHPNIISVHEVGVDCDGRPYFTMELKVGDGLDLVLKKAATDEAYTLSERLEIFLKVCDAVAYAHSRNVIHLDLKPSNVQVGKFGEVLVCDWGLGKFVGDPEDEVDHILLHPDLLSGMTLSGEIKGTPGFMAPEQVRGDAKDPRTDVYSLGALLYSILTCKPPLEGTTKTVLDSTAEGKLVSPIIQDPTVSQSLNAVVMQAMALTPDDRYQTVEALQADVRAYLAGYSPAAHKSGLANELRLFYGRHRALCNAVAVFVAVVGIMTYLFVNSLDEKRQEAIAAADVAIESARNERELAVRLRQEKEASETMLAEVVALTSTATATQLGETEQVEKENVLQRARSDLFLASPTTFYKLGVSSLEDMVHKTPTTENRGELGILYFIGTEFEKAKPMLAANPRLKTVSRINDAMLNTFDRERHLQSTSELMAVIEQLLNVNRRLLANKVVAYDYATIGYREGYYQLVDRFLRNDRGDAGKARFELDAETKTISVSCSRIASLNSFHSLPLLKYLQPKVLRISNANFITDWNFAEFETLETLDLSKAIPKNLTAVVVHPNLKTLVVRQGDLPDQVRAQLSQHMKIVEIQ